MTKQNNKAFTLVELIVVITILAVLATVAFISFQGYTSSSRDSVRLADLANISKSFEINRTKDIDFPLPDKKVDISASGIIFQYQGELSQNILEKNLNIFDGGLDPVTKKPYGYAVNVAKNQFQIIGFLENSENIANISQNTTFADNTDKYVKSSGDDLGILLDETTNEVIVQSGSLNEIDIQTNTNNFGIIIHKKIIHSNSSKIKSSLSYRYNKISSCFAILESGNSKGNGIYTINPTGISGEDFNVYCDMETNGGGWTYIQTQTTSSPFYMNHDAFWQDNYSGEDLIGNDFNMKTTGFYKSYSSVGFSEISFLSHSGNYSTFELINDYKFNNFYEIISQQLNEKGLTQSNFGTVNHGTQIGSLTKKYKVNNDNCGVTYGAGPKLYSTSSHHMDSHSSILHMHTSYFEYPRSSIVFGAHNGRAFGFQSDPDESQGNINCINENNSIHWDPSTYISIMIR